MQYNETQTALIDKIILTARNVEFAQSNKMVANAIQEWKNNEKNDKEAYDKIYKKVIKNEHHLVARYTQLDDRKKILVLAELYIENIIDHDMFDTLDEEIIEEVHQITRLRK